MGLCNWIKIKSGLTNITYWKSYVDLTPKIHKICLQWKGNFTWELKLCIHNVNCNKPLYTSCNQQFNVRDVYRNLAVYVIKQIFGIEYEKNYFRMIIVWFRNKEHFPQLLQTLSMYSVFIRGVFYCKFNNSATFDTWN